MNSKAVPNSSPKPQKADPQGSTREPVLEDLQADTVGIISLPVEPVTIDTTCEAVYERFIKAAIYHSLPVVTNGLPVGVVTRLKVLESFSQAGFREKHGHEPLTRLMSRDPFIVDHSMPVDLVGMLISEAGSQTLEEGFVVTRQGAYFGMATGRGLLRELTERKEANLEVMLNNATQDLKAAQKQLLEKQRMEQELEIAAEIQAALLPRSLPEIPGYEFFSFYRSAKEVGGDYYDFIKLADGNQALLVADVSGKGVPGSLGMTMVRSVLRSQASVSSEPAETLRRTNAIIQPDMRSGMFVTVFYAVLNPILHRLRCASGGHNEAIVVGAEGERLVAPIGIGLGLVTDELYYAEEEDVILKVGDTFILYTDGVTEAMNPEWEEYGEGRFNEFLLKNRTAPLKAIVSGILADITEFTQGAPQADDLTLVLLRRTV